MINWFLRAKHWQLFVLTFGVMIVAYITMMYSVFSAVTSSAAERRQPDPLIMFRYMKFLLFLGVFVMSVTTGWYWSVGTGLREKLPSGVTMKTTLFKAFLIFPLIYTTVFIFLMSMLLKQVFEATAGNGSPDTIALSMMSFFPIILPFHFFSVFCFFYNMYFVAKTIKAVELQRSVTFSDFIGEFFLVWFYPIGVWILQPKINRLHENVGKYGATDSTLLDDTIRN